MHQFPHLYLIPASVRFSVLTPLHPSTGPTCVCLLVIITPVVGSVLMTLTLHKYIRTRKQVASSPKDLLLQNSLNSQSQAGSSATAAMDTNEQSTHDRGLIIRFSIGLNVLMYVHSSDSIQIYPRTKLSYYPPASPKSPSLPTTSFKTEPPNPLPWPQAQTSL
jgi:hypothetical protein